MKANFRTNSVLIYQPSIEKTPIHFLSFMITDHLLCERFKVEMITFNQLSLYFATDNIKNLLKEYLDTGIFRFHLDNCL